MGATLITGATSSIDEEFCWRPAIAGHNLVPVTRSEDALCTLANSFANVTGIRTEVIVADLSTDSDCGRVAARLDVGGPAECDKLNLAPAGLLVNNAGFGLGAEFLDNSLENEIKDLSVMVRAIMAPVHHTGISMHSRGRDTILNADSVASRTNAGTYFAHRAWVVIFTEGLIAGPKGSRTTATVVCPGPVDTPFFEHAGIDTRATPSWLIASPEQVVTGTLGAMRTDRVQAASTIPYKIAIGTMKLAPRWVTVYAIRSVPYVWGHVHEYETGAGFTRSPAPASSVHTEGQARSMSSRSGV